MLTVICNIKVKQTNLDSTIEIGKTVVNKKLVNTWKKLNGRLDIGKHGVWGFSGNYSKKIADRVWLFPFDEKNGYNSASYKQLKSRATLNGKQVDKFLTKVTCGKPLSGNGQIVLPPQTMDWRMYRICGSA